MNNLWLALEGAWHVLLAGIILGMGASTVLMGLLPTYAQIGIWAPILLVVLRLIQGLSAAGETIGSNSFVAEHAPPHRRGLHVAFTYAFANLPPVAAAGPAPGIQVPRRPTSTTTSRSDAGLTRS